jgi:uncharacterized OB-fold protein
MTCAGARVDLRAERPAERYQELLTAGTVPYQRCGECRRPVFAPRVLCPLCGSTDLSWHESSGRGVVYSATTVHSRNADPYTVVLVDLDEGFRVMATLTGVEPDDDGSAIGARVEVSAGERDGRRALLAAPVGAVDGGASGGGAA